MIFPDMHQAEMERPWTVGFAFTWASNKLVAADIETAALDARILLDWVAGDGGGAILAWRERRLTETRRQHFLSAVARRAQREPVARILGEKEFWSLSFQLSEETLVPRPDSELLVETALGLLDDHSAPTKVLDLGTGSGCLLLAVLSERFQARGLGIDISAGAVAMAATNAERLGLIDRAHFQVGNWGDELMPGFDLILCNPPYIPSGRIATLDAEVAVYDPRRALDGGLDGLAAVRIAAAAATRLLSRGGNLVMEIGSDQEVSATNCLRLMGLSTCPALHDLAGQPRCLVGRLG